MCEQPAAADPLPYQYTQPVAGTAAGRAGIGPTCMGTTADDNGASYLRSRAGQPTGRPGMAALWFS